MICFGSLLKICCCNFQRRLTAVGPHDGHIFFAEFSQPLTIFSPLSLK
jgi:hypothetical protein